MRKSVRYSIGILVLVITLAAPSGTGLSVTPEEFDRNIKVRETSFYREFFDRILYDQIAQLFRLDRMKDKISFKKREARDINSFDEVPDSSFFVNRNARNHLGLSELKEGPSKGSGPDPKGLWRVLKGKTAGVSAGFLIEDQKQDRYLLKFDPKDNPEMATSAEIISQKFFHAMGYNVPEYYLVNFSPDILKPDPKATYYNKDGFKKPLTQEALQEILERVPKFKGGVVRASASKILREAKGYMSLEGRRKADPEDLIPHEDRRSLRALRVFGSWLNHYDLREGNTLDVVETENGKPAVKHYLIDFGASLGSASSHPKVPAAGYEHVVDWFAVGKAAPTLKVVEKPWEKKWDALNRQIAYPALGYFDNFQFDPHEWKTQLPYEVFNRLTRGDAFWAAKILKSFSDEDVRSVVESGEFSDPENAKLLSEILIARRDIIARYWFSHVTPLDQARLSELEQGKYQIRFADLFAQSGFSKPEESRYRYRLIVVDPKGHRRQFKGWQEVDTPSFSFEISSLGSGSKVILHVQARHGAKGIWSEPPLKVIFANTAQDTPISVVEIDHGV